MEAFEILGIVDGDLLLARRRKDALVGCADEGAFDTVALRRAILCGIGGVLYGLKWPNPWPRTFGHHEFFHACTLVAAICHHIAIYFALFA